MGPPTPPGARPGVGPRPPWPGGGGMGLPDREVGGRRAPGGGGMGLPDMETGGRRAPGGAEAGLLLGPTGRGAGRAEPPARAGPEPSPGAGWVGAGADAAAAAGWTGASEPGRGPVPE